MADCLANSDGAAPNRLLVEVVKHIWPEYDTQVVSYSKNKFISFEGHLAQHITQSSFVDSCNELSGHSLMNYHLC